MPAVLALLKNSGLPYQDIDTRPSIEFLVAAPGQSLLGAVGLEQYDDTGLLRSLVVRPESRWMGLGMQLADAMEERAGKAGVTALYLLTTTAADFFARRGYQVIQRSDAPSVLQSTSEFSSLCPAQAVCMYKALI